SALPIACHRFRVHAPVTTAVYTLSLHDALPICAQHRPARRARRRLTLPRKDTLMTSLLDRPTSLDVQQLGGRIGARIDGVRLGRSEEHTSELQSRFDLVCRLLLEKKKYQEVTVD